MENLSAIAIAYRSLGLSVLPVIKGKRPPGYWRKYQRVYMSDNQIINGFNRATINGIAIVCGTISGNFEGIDVDSKYDLSGTLINRFCQAVEAYDPHLLQRLVIATTRNAGYHFYYRCTNVGRSMVLARRSSTPEELAIHPNEPGKTLLETRSNGAIIIVPPTNGYRFIQKDFHGIPTVDPAERQALLDIARSFNLYQPETTAVCATVDIRNETTKVSPFLAYDATDDVIECLQSNGWELVRRIGPRTYFKRPGDTDKDTSANFHHELRRFKAFTTNSIFEPEKPYHPYAVFAFLECNKDFDLAAKKLVAKGYGVAYKNRLSLT